MAARTPASLHRQPSVTDKDIRSAESDEGSLCGDKSGGSLDVDKSDATLATIVNDQPASPSPPTELASNHDAEGVNDDNSDTPGGDAEVVQGLSKGGRQGATSKKIGFGAFFPAVRKLAAADREDHDSVVRVSIAELCMFVISLICMMVYTFGRRSETEYFFTSVHRGIFTENDSNGDRITFNDISTKADFWTYMKNEFINAVYWEEWYNGDTPFPYQGFVFGESKLLGLPQMRQLRVKEGMCRVHDQFAELISECYDSYTKAGEDKDSIGGIEGKPYQWASEDETGYGGHRGEVAKYGGSGYIVDLATTKNETLTILEELQDNLWLDRSSRVVLIDVNLYNANLNLFLIIRLAAEFPPSGGVVIDSKFMNVKLLRYHSTKDMVFAGFEIAYLITILYYLAEMFFTAKYIGIRAMVFRFWTWYDLLNFTLGLTYLAFSLKSHLDVTESLEDLVSDESRYMNFEDMAYVAEVFREMNAINVFLSWIKLFKFLSFTKTMAELQATLVNSAGDLMGFMLMFGIVFVAYAQCGYLIFGAILRDFSTFPDALFTLFRIILGDFDFIALDKANYIMGPIYFISFVVVVFFVLLNMFLAIVADTYSNVKGDTRYGDRGKIFGRYFKRLASDLKKKLRKLEKLEDRLRNADVNEDSFIDMPELIKAVGEEDAKLLMDKFDLSQDQRISIFEKDKMMATLMDERVRTKELINKAEAKEDDMAASVGMPGGMVDVEEFERLSNRVHRLERSLGTVASRIATMVNKMEKIERARSRSITQQLVKKKRESEVTDDAAARNANYTSFEL